MVECLPLVEVSLRLVSFSVHGLGLFVFPPLLPFFSITRAAVGFVFRGRGTGNCRGVGTNVFSSGYIKSLLVATYVPLAFHVPDVIERGGGGHGGVRRDLSNVGEVGQPFRAVMSEVQKR